uniref:Single stranded DNA binding protein 4 n=1 Tax=Varanus komodoensis TaxID=61221 RepID=A0A8D2IQU6_VARKO
VWGSGKAASSAPRLALYVYEYLLHIGAQKSAQTFLSEVRWEKNITLGEPPGFLHSWWCVFWDLYCAAPDRRDVCEHPSEAKPFRDYVSTQPTCRRDGTSFAGGRVPRPRRSGGLHPSGAKGRGRAHTAAHRSRRGEQNGRTGGWTFMFRVCPGHSGTCRTNAVPRFFGGPAGPGRPQNPVPCRGCHGEPRQGGAACHSIHLAWQILLVCVGGAVPPLTAPCDS